MAPYLGLKPVEKARPDTEKGIVNLEISQSKKVEEVKRNNSIACDQSATSFRIEVKKKAAEEADVQQKRPTRPKLVSRVRKNPKITSRYSTII